MSAGNFSEPSKDWAEHVDEASERAAVEQFMEEVIKPRQLAIAGNDPQKIQRGFHAKLHAAFRAEFEVLADLPEFARQGVFREPHVYEAVVRFSNGRPDCHPDTEKEPRGIAIKLFGVSGHQLLEERQTATTQDFLATSHSLTSVVRDIHEFMAVVKLDFDRHGNAASFHQLLRDGQAVAAGGVAETIRIVGGLFDIARSRVASMATEHYSGTAPIRFGPYAVKFSVIPAAGTPAAPEPPESDAPDFLRKELAERVRGGDLKFDFFVQFYVNEEVTPIEDTSVPWTPENAPLVRVATLRIPRCDLSDAGVQAVSENIQRLSFNPWHAIEDHRPLGNIMRARKIAYEISARFRNAAAEPVSAEGI